MRVLVTGGAGFIGTHLCIALSKMGWNVHIFDKKPQDTKDSGYIYFQSDVRNLDAVTTALKDIDLIIHLAASHHDSGITREEFFSVNEVGTKTLLKGASFHGIKRIIFTSTVAVYGTSIHPTTENTATKPDSPYGESKLAAETAIIDWANEITDRAALIIRPTVVFGPYNFANIYKLINIIVRHRYLQVGKGDKIKSLAYVENLVDAMLFLMDHNYSDVKIYNYADEPHLQTREFVKIISNHLGITPPSLRLPLWLGILAGKIFDQISKITKKDFPVTKARIMKTCTATHHSARRIMEEGFKPRISLEEGFEKTITWLRSNKYI